MTTTILPASRRHPRRLAVLALLLALGAVLVGVGAAVGSGAGLWSFRPAFTALRWAFFAAAGGGALALVALVWGLVARAGTLVISLIAVALAAGYCSYLVSWIGQASAVPAIHDISTDLADPPQFRTLTLRADNLDSIPDGDDPALAALTSLERLHSVQRRGYPDVATLRLDAPPARAFAAAEELVRQRGWTVATADPAAGTIEATDTVSLFRFKDDVVIRTRPAPGGSVVDVRSVSRVGVSDLGVNARRVTAFLADLKDQMDGTE